MMNAHVTIPSFRNDQPLSVFLSTTPSPAFLLYFTVNPRYHVIYTYQVFTGEILRYNMQFSAVLLC